MRIVRETGRSVAQVARDLGVNEGTLGNWVHRDAAERAGGLCADDASIWCGCAKRTRLCRWSVMCSKVPWSVGSTRPLDDI